MRLAWLALLGGAVLLTVGLIALYGRAAVLDERGFADRATSAFASDEVQDEVSRRLADREIAAAPALAAQRPALEAAIAGLVDEWPRAFRAGTVNLHRGLFDGGTADLTLPGAGVELHAALPPKSAALVPETDPALFQLGGGRLESDLVRAAPEVRRLARSAPLVLGAGLLLLLACAWRAPTRRRGARRAALGLALAGGTIVAATTVGRAVVLSTFDTSHGDAVVGQIWDAFLGDLRLWGLAAGAFGLIAGAAFEPGARGAWRRWAALVLAPCGAAARLARAFALFVLAALLLWMPEVPLDLALVSAAGALVFTAAAEVARLLGAGGRQSPDTLSALSLR